MDVECFIIVSEKRKITFHSIIFYFIFNIVYIYIFFLIRLIELPISPTCN